MYSSGCRASILFFGLSFGFCWLDVVLTSLDDNPGFPQTVFHGILRASGGCMRPFRSPDRCHEPLFYFVAAGFLSAGFGAAFLSPFNHHISESMASEPI